MKKLFAILFGVVLLMGCTNDNARYVNPNIPNYSFNLIVNMNLPSYSGLNSPVNPIYISQDGAGVAGIIVMKVSDTDFRAWEANCPNHPLSSCSRMSISGVNAKCNCDNVTYSLFTGVGEGKYSMKSYMVELMQGNSIRIFN